MGPLLAVVLATPIWGLALQPPTLDAIDVAPLAQIRDVVTPTSEAPRLTPPFDHTLVDLTRAFQVGSTVAMAMTAMLGAIQFGDEYGFHARQQDTRCAHGDAVLASCGTSPPAAHLGFALGTAALGLTAFVLTTQVDFEAMAREDGDWRVYEVTRWVGLGMFVVQALGGFLIANAVQFGWANPQSDFTTLQGLAAAHMVWGIATLGLETANTILAF
jgi:hypothetical protein